MDEAVLQAEVCQNQAIEHIAFDPNSNLTQDHLKTARYAFELVADGIFPNVRELHGALMRQSGLDLPCIGAWRTWAVFVGERKDVDDESEDGSEKPAASHVPWLMEEWEHTCKVFLSTCSSLSGEEKERLCDHLYYHFECIHPFADGNGRTGRLMRNALRVLCGLPWHIITSDVHCVYVSRLRKYEDTDFRKKYPNVY